MSCTCERHKYGEFFNIYVGLMTYADANGLHSIDDNEGDSRRLPVSISDSMSWTFLYRSSMKKSETISSL